MLAQQLEFDFDRYDAISNKASPKTDLLLTTFPSWQLIVSGGLPNCRRTVSMTFYSVPVLVLVRIHVCWLLLSAPSAVSVAVPGAAFIHLFNIQLRTIIRICLAFVLFFFSWQLHFFLFLFLVFFTVDESFNFCISLFIVRIPRTQYAAIVVAQSIHCIHLEMVRIACTPHWLLFGYSACCFTEKILNGLFHRIVSQ